MRRNPPVVSVKNAPIFFRNKISILFSLLKRDERVRSGKLSWGGGQDHPLPGHEQHGLHPLHRQDHRNPSKQSLCGNCFGFASWSVINLAMWLRIRVQLGYVTPIHAQLGLCGSESGFNLDCVDPDPDSGMQNDLQKELATTCFKTM